MFILTILKSNMTLQLPKMRVWSWQVAQLGIILVVLGLSIFLFNNQQSALASQGGWLQGDPKLISGEPAPRDYQSKYSTYNDCYYETVTYIYGKKDNQKREAEMCITQGDGFRLAEAGRGSIGISVGMDSKFYKLDNRSMLRGFILIPGTQKILIAYSWDVDCDSLGFYDNFLSSLKRQPDGTYKIRFTDDSLIWRSGGRICGWGMSRNGKYVAYGISTTSPIYSTLDNLVLANTETGEKSMFGRAVGAYQTYPVKPGGFAISDDGKQIASTAWGRLKFWNITSSCTIEVSREPLNGPDPCPSRSFSPRWYGAPSGSDSHYLKANRDFTELYYSYRPNYPTGYMGMTIRQYGLVDTTQLDYLAMGDSYSSGEGDVGYGPLHYIVGTAGKKECHLSDRSYPFLLRRYWGVHPLKMKSVACSGSRVLHDYIMPMKYYIGQHEELEDLSNEGRLERRKKALGSFMPGIVPQLEFVRKYKPKLVTLTGGGNDVGFGDILKACANTRVLEAPQELNPVDAETCSYAGNSTVKDTLINSIRNQYGATRLLIRKIRKASPQTRIVIIGYPRFITDKTAICGLNAGFLNSRERAFINDMLKRLNNVIWRAATDEGVIFIDIEHLFEGGQLCQGTKYVTGVTDALSLDKRYHDLANSFHPNHRGHAKIAEVINQKVRPFPWNQYPGDTRQAEDGSFYSSAPITRMVRMVEDMVIQSTDMLINLPNGTFQPNSKVKASIFSEETSLGELTASSSGSLSTKIKLPDSIKPGYHTLILKGKTYSGEPITLYQIVTVISNIEGDKDGDGIPDDKDRCMFIKHMVDESTERDLCMVSEDDKPDAGVDDVTTETKRRYAYGKEVDRSVDQQDVTDSPSSSASPIGGGGEEVDGAKPSIDDQVSNTTTTNNTNTMYVAMITSYSIIIIALLFLIKTRGKHDQ